MLNPPIPDISKQEHRARAASEDPRKLARELARESTSIEDQIKKLEIEAGRQIKEDQVTELLAERDRLKRRQEALPFLLRGAQARALRVQASALEEAAAIAEGDWKKAIATAEAAIARHAAAERELKAATEASAAAVRLRDEAEREYWHLKRAEGLALGDATLIEQGKEPTTHSFAEPD